MLYADNTNSVHFSFLKRDQKYALDGIQRPKKNISLKSSSGKHAQVLVCMHPFYVIKTLNTIMSQLMQKQVIFIYPCTTGSNCTVIV